MTDSQNRAPEPPPAPENKDRDPQPEQPDPHTRVVLPAGTPNPQDMRDLTSSRKLIMIANVAGPVSLFIGGVLLGSIGFICGIIGYRKLSALMHRQAGAHSAASRLRRSSIIGMVICALAITINAISMYYIFPEFLKLLESGDYTGLFSDISNKPAAPSTIWG